jgi:hypothetical protein
MRRTRVLMVVVLAMAGVTVWAGAAEARGSKFCDTVRSFYEDGAGELPALSDLDVSEDEIQETLDSYEDFANAAPKKLRKPFRTLLKFYKQVTEDGFDFTDPEALEEFAEQSAKLGRATTKIYNYLEDECDIELPELPDATVPDVSISDISIPDVSIPELDGT